MVLLHTVTLEHTPSSHTAHIALFRNVKNVQFLIQQLHEGNVEFEYAVIDARVILSTMHLFAAVFRAINLQISNKLRTRNLHSEIVFSLSPRNNIATSFLNFGISAQTLDVIIVKVSDVKQHEIVRNHLSRVIEGNAVEFSDATLTNVTDWPRVKKLYGLDNTSLRHKSTTTCKLKQSYGKGEDPETEEREKFRRDEIEVLVLGAIALKGATN